MATPEKPEVNISGSKPASAGDKPRGKNPLKTAKVGGMMALEPRILLDAALADTAAKVADAVAHDGKMPEIAPKEVNKDIFKALAPVGRDQVRREIIFVDSRTENLKELLGQATPNRQVVVLSPNRDGVVQITRVLSRMQRVDAVHIFSHGDAGRIQLGKGELSIDNIQKYQKYLKAWAAHMSNAADILIYGCDVAAGAKGADFVRTLAELTQADVAASTDLTGAADQGGDWDLEKKVGDIETDLALSVHGRDEFHETLAYTNATFGSRLYFDGSASTGKVSMDNTGKTMIDSTQSIAFEAWIKPDSDTATGVRIIVTGQDSGTGNSASTPGAFALANGKLRFYTQTSLNATPPTPTFNYVDTANTIGTIDGATWFHVAATWDATTHLVKFYVNGTQVTTGSYNNNGSVGTSLNAGSDSSFVTIGARADGLTSQRFKGEIDDVRLYKGTLPTINATHVNSPLVGNETGLVGYWKLNDVSGTTAADSQTNITAHNGTINTSGVTWINPPSLGGLTGAIGINDNATSSPFSTTTITDADTTGATFTVTITQKLNGGGTDTTQANGAFSVLGTGGNLFTDNGNGTYTLTGVTAAQAQASLQALVFTPTANQVAVGSTVISSFDLSVNDGTPIPAPAFPTATTDSSTVLTVTSINDVPTIGGAATATINDTATSTVFSGVTITEPDFGQTVSITITQKLFGGATDTGKANGSFTSASLTASGFTDNGNGTYTITGQTAAQAQAKIRQLVFQPTANQVAPGNSTQTTFQIDVTDTNSPPSSAPANTTTVLTVNSVNDAPTGIGNLTLASVAEDTAAPAGALVSAMTGYVFTDVDASATLGGIAVTGNTANPTTQGVWEYSSDGTNWTAIGTTVNDGASAKAISAGSKIRFVPVANYNGTPPGLSVRALDNTYTGGYSTFNGAAETVVNVNTTTRGGSTAISNTANTIDTSITAVNDAPTMTLATTTTVSVGTPEVLDATATIADPELTAAGSYSGATLTIARNGGASANDVFSAKSGGTLTMTGASGSISVGATTVGTFTNSGGTLVITFGANATGTLVNSVLQQIAYDNGVDGGPITLDMVFNDQNTGAQGSGGALSVTKQIAVTLTSGASASITAMLSSVGGATTDSGTVGDYYTSSSSPALSGTLSTNAALTGGQQLRYQIDGGTWTALTTQPDASGLWSTGTDLGTLASGAHTIGIGVFADTNTGNQTPLTQTSHAVTIDTTGPSAPTVAELTTTKTGDGWMNATENGTTTTFRVTLPTTGSTAVAGDTVELLLGGASFGTPKTVTLSAGDITNGYVDFTVASGTTDLGADGAKALTAKITDVAGNAGTPSSALNFTLDTAAPSAPTTAVDLLAPSDSGVSSTDNLTKTIAPTLRVSLAGTGAVSGDTVELLLGGASLGTPATAVLTGTDITNGYVDLTVTGGDLNASGAKSFTGRVTDAAGNVGTGGGTLVVTLDTVAPTVTDANISITSTGTGTGGAYKIGDTITARWTNTGGDGNADIAGVTMDFSAFGGGSAVTATETAPGSGIYEASYILASGSLNGVTTANVAVTATDNAGNTTTTSDLTGPTIDNVAPTQTVTGLAMLYDRAPPADITVSQAATNNTDFITKYAGALGTEQAFSGTLSGALGTGEVLWGSLDSGNTWTDLSAGGFVTGTAVNWTGLILPTGTNTLQFKVVDGAGNTSSITSQAYTVDTTAPTTASIDYATLTSSLPTITGTYDPTTQLGSGGILVFDPNDGFHPAVYIGVDPGTSYNATNGTWSIDFSQIPAYATKTWSDGAANVFVWSCDTAGNWSKATSGTSFWVDTTPPNAPTVTPVAANSLTPIISGTLSAPLADGTGAQSVETLTVTVGGATYNVTPSGTNWSLDLSTATPASGALSLAAGNVYEVTATVTDAAGQSASDVTTGELIIDTTAPSAPTVNALTTNAALPTLTGTATLATAAGAVTAESLTVTVGGATYNVTPSGGTWSLNLATATPASGTLNIAADGTYQVVATITDAAGNATSDATTGELVIDRTAPTAPTVNALTSGSTTPTLTGTATVLAGESLTVTVGGATYNVTPSGGNWSLNLATATPASGTLSLTTGTYNVTATVTDLAGNATSDTTASELTIAVVDTVPPAAPTINAVTTRSTQPTITGTFDATDHAGGFTVSVNGTTYTLGVDAALTASGNTWSLNLATAGQTLPNGTFNVVATATDGSGNSASDTSLGEIVVDTVAPLAPVITGPVEGAKLSGSSTTVTGTGEPGATMRVYDTDGTTLLGTTTVGSNGTWSIPNVRLSAGDHTLYARQTDRAGNVSPDKTVSFNMSAVDPSTLITSTPTAAAAAAGTTAPSSGIGVEDAGTPIIDTVRESLSQTTLSQVDTASSSTAGSTTDAGGTDTGTTTGAEATLNAALNTPSGAGQQRTAPTGARPGAQAPDQRGNTMNVDQALSGQIVQLSPDSFEVVLPSTTLIGDIIYTGTLPDGTPLPDYIEVDPVTGKVTIHRDKAPLGVNKLNVKVSRIVQNGDLKDVKSASFNITVNKEAKVNLGNNQQTPAPAPQPAQPQG